MRKTLLVLLLLAPVILQAQTFRARKVRVDSTLTADSIWARAYGNIPPAGIQFSDTSSAWFVSRATLNPLLAAKINYSDTSAAWFVTRSTLNSKLFKWVLSGQSLVSDSLRFVQGANITLTQSGNTLTIAGSAGSAFDSTSLSDRINADSTDGAKRAWVNSLRGSDTTRAIVRESLKIAYSDTSLGWFVSRTTLNPLLAAKLDTSFHMRWQLSGQDIQRDSLRFIQGSNITLTETGNTLTIASTASGSFKGWYVNGQSLVTDTLRFLTPTSMVFTQSGSTISIYPDTGTGKIATKTDVAAKGTSNYRGWYVGGQSLVTDTLRFLTPGSMVLTQSGSTLSLYPDTSAGKIATKTDVNAKGTSNYRGWYVNGQSLVTDTLRFLQPTSMVFTQSGTTIAIYPDTSAGKIATKTDVGAKIAYSDTALAWFVSRTTLNPLLAVKLDTSRAMKWALSGQATARDSLRFIQGTNITLTQSGNTLTIAGAAGSGEVNTASNMAGAGVGLWKDKSTYDLRFKRISNLRNTKWADATDSVTVAVDSIAQAYVDSTGRAISEHGVSAIVYNADSSKYKAQKLLALDTAGTYLTSRGDYGNIVTDSTGLLHVAKPSVRNGTSFAGVGIWIMNAENTLASGTQANVNGHIRAFPFLVSKTMTIDSINYIVSTAGAGAATIAIYRDSAVAGIGPSYPGAIMILGGRDTTSAAIKSSFNLVGNPKRFSPGLYWVAVSSNGTATLRSVPVGAMLNVLGYNPSVAATQAYTCWDVTRAYDQFLPDPFPASGTRVVNIGAPLLVMRVKSVP